MRPSMVVLPVESALVATLLGCRGAHERRGGLSNHHARAIVQMMKSPMMSCSSATCKVAWRSLTKMCANMLMLSRVLGHCGFVAQLKLQLGSGGRDGYRGCGVCCRGTNVITVGAGRAKVFYYAQMLNVMVRVARWNCVSRDAKF